MESHGVVGNYMWDADLDRHFELPMELESTLHPDWWSGSESFFITAEMQVRGHCLYVLLIILSPFFMLIILYHCSVFILTSSS